EERHDGGDLGGLAKAAGRNTVEDFLHRRRRVAAIAALENRTQHAALDHAGTDAIDPHAGVRAFPGYALGKSNDRVLARAINCKLRRTHQARYRGGVDNAALVLLQHHRQHVFQPQKNADDINIDDTPECFKRILGDRLDLAFDPRIVVEDVDSAEL